MRRHLAAAVELARSAHRLLLGEAGDGAMNGADGADAELAPEPHPASVAPDNGEDLLSALPDELKARGARVARHIALLQREERKRERRLCARR